MSEHPANALAQETSPYLLQHANNPVDWYPWGEKALQKAKDENKLMLISIGYAACHWCHVMERESFEDSTVAAAMNKNFVNIKVDREERPDVDQVYMTAVQLMTQRGGWPLNVVTLPDGRPVWGGTYFPKADWMNALGQIQSLYEKDPKKLEEYAANLEKGLKEVDEVITINTDKIEFNPEFIAGAVETWSSNFDHDKGGLKRTPKFMMPSNYHFLLRYAHQTDDTKLNTYVHHTLRQMAYGGVYDHLRGGFARYSTDAKWHVPHFEKMLYDNAQLVSLYSDAYLQSGNELYKEVVYETLDFVTAELTNEEGAFYSSLDADSTTEEGELEEGAYYVWNKEELKKHLESDYELFKDYYNINPYGLWEKGNYVLIRKEDDAAIAKTHNISVEELKEKKKKWKTTLLQVQEKRGRPRLDDKTLTSWNGLMLKGYVDAYRVFDEPRFLKAAVTNAEFIRDRQLQKDGALFHSYKNGKSTINGYLEDYAAVIQGYLALYEVTLDPQWLQLSGKMADYTKNHFLDAEKSLFYFTSDQDPALVTRKIDYQDNVIPSSNAMMARNLYLLSHHLDQKEYEDIAKQALHNIQPEMADYASGYSHWLQLMLDVTYPFYEVVVVGDQARTVLQNLERTYYPNKLIAGSTSDTNLPLLENRYTDGETLVYVCVDKACKYPVDSAEKAFGLMK